MSTQHDPEHFRRTIVEYLTSSATMYENKSISKSPTCSAIMYADAFKRFAAVLEKAPFLDDQEAVEHVLRAAGNGRGDLVSQLFRHQVKSLLSLLGTWRTAQLVDGDTESLTNVSNLIQKLGREATS